MVNTRMLLLCDHYDVDRGDWMALAFVLAQEWVPGLQTAQARTGPGLKWGDYEKVRARVAIDCVMREQNRNELDAATFLLRRTAWRKYSSRPSSWGRHASPSIATLAQAKTLLRQAQKAHPAWCRIFEAAVRYQVKKDACAPITLADVERVDYS